MKCRLVLGALLLFPFGAPLSAAPPEPPRRDLHGDALPAGAVLRCPTGVNTIAFSPDGKTLAVGCRRGGERLADGLDVALWGVAERKVERRLSGHRDGVEQVAFTPDGKTLLSIGSDRTLLAWDPAAGKCVREWPTAERRFALRAGGKEVVAVDDKGGLCVWEIATGKQVRR